MIYDELYDDAMDGTDDSVAPCLQRTWERDSNILIALCGTISGLDREDRH